MSGLWPCGVRAEKCPVSTRSRCVQLVALIEGRLHLLPVVPDQLPQLAQVRPGDVGLG